MTPKKQFLSLIDLRFFALCFVCTCLAPLSCANAQAPATPLPSLIGTYATDPAPGEWAISLACESDLKCAMKIFASKSSKTPLETRRFDSVSRLREPQPVFNALKFTKEQLAKPEAGLPADLIAARTRLALLGQVELGTDNCHDLGSPEGDAYLVVCRLQNSPWAQPTILFFGTQMSNCGPMFCRYMILPMFAKAEKPL
jgi:hypothetical protein